MLSLALPTIVIAVAATLCAIARRTRRGGAQETPVFDLDAPDVRARLGGL